MIVLNDYRLIFIKTRKTAGTSVEIALSACAGGTDLLTPLVEPDESLRRELGGHGSQNFEVALRRYRARDWGRLLFKRRAAELSSHAGATRVRAALGRQLWDSYHKVTIERNPYDRLVSLYWWDTLDALVRPLFMDFIAGLPPNRISNFPLYSISGEVAVDRILRYERLDSDLRVLADDLGMELPALPRAKSGVRPQDRSGPDMMSKGARKLIAEACAKEIQLMGYES